MADEATWASSDETKGIVDANGVVTGVAEGSTSIRATIDGVTSDPFRIDVVAAKVAVTGVTLDKDDYPVKVGADVTAVATVAPDNATNKAVTWKSSDETLAKVDASGKITGVKAGKPTITVTTADGSKTASATVTVTAA